MELNKKQIIEIFLKAGYKVGRGRWKKANNHRSFKQYFVFVFDDNVDVTVRKIRNSNKYAIVGNGYVFKKGSNELYDLLKGVTNIECEIG